LWYIFRMKPDMYTKVILTAIALALSILAAEKFTHPATVQAQNPSGRQFAVGPAGYYFYGNGKVTLYGMDGHFVSDISIR